ncbi:hypothetical protein F8M41_018604 [Gigaspora margarita]|uniref:Uncharacterized protein n=1 Tax=Gigaspora margarita TaxID=4874 RepID=A0A8H4ALF1_GIGMA|nr:hypothetical protein F8M41_018604 [Gigaspora margarita]
MCRRLIFMLILYLDYGSFYTRENTFRQEGNSDNSSFFHLGVTNEQDIMSRICLGVRNYDLQEAVKQSNLELASSSGAGQERRVEYV